MARLLLALNTFKAGVLGGVLISAGYTLALVVFASGSSGESPSSSSLMDACFLLAKMAFKAATCWPMPCCCMLVHAAAAAPGGRQGKIP